VPPITVAAPTRPRSTTRPKAQAGGLEERQGPVGGRSGMGGLMAASWRAACAHGARRAGSSPRQLIVAASSRDGDRFPRVATPHPQFRPRQQLIQDHQRSGIARVTSCGRSTDERYHRHRVKSVTSG